jgi:hypothetical protein
MLGRARCVILFAFALAFIVQLAVVFIYLPSSSISSGLLLDESAFPASPALRAMSKIRTATNSSAVAAINFIHHPAKKPGLSQLSPLLHMPIVAVYRPSYPSVAVPPTTEKPALTPTNFGQNYDLVLRLLSAAYSNFNISSLK